MTFDEVTKKLSDTFGGQATTQADTFQGRLQRLQVAFDEAKESIGARLLPILTNLVTYFTDNVGPIVDTVKEKIKPLTTAIENNKEEFKALWNFVKDFLVPFMNAGLKLAFTGLVSSVTTLVNIVGRAVNFFQSLYDKYKQFVDFLKNNPLSKWLGSVNPFSNSNFVRTGFEDDTGDTIRSVVSSNPFVPNQPFTPSQAYLDAVARTEELKSKTAEIRARIEARKSGATESSSGLTINVLSPSVIDREGFSRAVVDALNESNARNGGGAAALLGGITA
jgi:hypothetical protein